MEPRVPASLLRRPFAAGALALLALACSGSPKTIAKKPHQGPIILITLEGLRADEVGSMRPGAGSTPNLDQLVEEATWSGSGVASSSWVAPATASILTGLPPHQHRLLHGDQANLGNELTSLPEGLRRLGYESHAYVSGPWLTAERGFRQGFDSFKRRRRGKRSVGHLESLDGGRDFVWIHIADPQVPFIRRDWLNTGNSIPGGLPYKVTSSDLAPFRSGERELTEADQERFRALYRLDVAWADETLGRLLTGLRTSGHWKDSLLVVSGTHGQEFGEHGGILDGEHLGREVLEVPVVIKMAEGQPAPSGASSRIATSRLWATIIEAAGGSRPPAVAPSLLEEGRSAILSELFKGDGVRELSILDGDLQLRSRHAFGAHGFGPAPIVAERRSFERWRPEGGVALVENAARESELAGSLNVLRSEFLEEDFTPERERRQWTGLPPPGRPAPLP